MDTPRKSLLIRADFVLGEGRGGERVAYRRWRRILSEALPRLMGCADRAPRAERIRLHDGEANGSFSGWVRLPIQRRPSRKRLRKFRAALRNRLEAALHPIDGRVVKVGVRRCRGERQIGPVQRTLPFVEPAALQLASDRLASLPA
jgi:hypothetical protein